MIALATRSDDTAVKGGALKKRTRTGVMRAPPPMPVRPTTMPIAKHTTVRRGSIMCEAATYAHACLLSVSATHPAPRCRQRRGHARGRSSSVHASHGPRQGNGGWMIFNRSYRLREAFREFQSKAEGRRPNGRCG